MFRSFDGETVLLNLRSGQYHGVNPTGGRMIELLRDTGSMSATAEVLAAETGHPLEGVERDLADLCEQLRERGLIELHASSGN